MYMGRIFVLTLLVMLFVPVISAQETFPDGTSIPNWFYDTKIVDIEDLGARYVITEHGVGKDSAILQTELIQSVIDKADAAGGGVIIVPKGVFLTGSLFFKPKTHLYLEDGAVLKGSDDISHFPIVETRIEGQTVKYFPALINADHIDGFTVSGSGAIDGNGLRYWKAFWLRREWNPKCTNMDEMRPRLLYISNSNDVQISGIKMINSPFWTSHYYKCDNLKLLNLTFLAPASPVKAPSSDAVDLDVCSNVLIKNCYMSVNDDAIALKGGKGPKADKDENNGGNYNIIIEDCDFGFCHSVLTCGSESLHNRNVIMRHCKVDGARRLLHLKMRPDTPQNYEYITVENVSGNVGSFLFVHPWTQFFDLKGEDEIPMSYSKNVVMRNIELKCRDFFDVEDSEQYELSNFSFQNINITAENPEFFPEYIQNFKLENVKVNNEVFVQITKNSTKGIRSESVLIKGQYE